MLSKSDDIGDRCKFFEDKFTSINVFNEKPVLCRIDGRAFHTFTKDLKKPFDIRFGRSMIETAKHLVRDSRAEVGYTQSDEISLFWKSGLDLFFAGRVQKLNSVLASMATAFFIREAGDLSPRLPVFDSRIWSVETNQDVVDYFNWRQMDGIRNSVSMVSRAYFSFNQCQNKKTKELKSMLLEEKGVNWDDFKNMWKFGTFIRNRQVSRPFTESEISNLPPKHNYFYNPELVTKRSVTMEEDFPQLSKIKNVFEVIIQSEEPILIS